MTDTQSLVQITLGQGISILSGIAAFFAIVGGAFKLGSLAQRVETNEQTVVQKLVQFAERFTAFEEYVAHAAESRQEWAAWRSGVDMNISHHQGEVVRHAKSNHEMRNTLHQHELRLAVLEAQRAD